MRFGRADPGSLTSRQASSDYRRLAAIAASFISSLASRSNSFALAAWPAISNSFACCAVARRSYARRARSCAWARLGCRFGSMFRAGSCANATNATKSPMPTTLLVNAFAILFSPADLLDMHLAARCALLSSIRRHRGELHFLVSFAQQRLGARGVAAQVEFVGLLCRGQQIVRVTRQFLSFRDVGVATRIDVLDGFGPRASCEHGN